MFSGGLGGLTNFNVSPERAAAFSGVTSAFFGGGDPNAVRTWPSGNAHNRPGTPQLPQAPVPAPAIGGTNYAQPVDGVPQGQPMAPNTMIAPAPQNWGGYAQQMMGNGIPQMAQNLVNRMPMAQPAIANMQGGVPGGGAIGNMQQNVFAKYGSNPYMQRYLPQNFLQAFNGQAWGNMPLLLSARPQIGQAQPGWTNMANNMLTQIR